MSWVDFAYQNTFNEHTYCWYIIGFLFDYWVKSMILNASESCNSLSKNTYPCISTVSEMKTWFMIYLIHCNVSAFQNSLEGKCTGFMWLTYSFWTTLLNFINSTLVFALHKYDKQTSKLECAFPFSDLIFVKIFAKTLMDKLFYEYELSCYLC